MFHNNESCGIVTLGGLAIFFLIAIVMLFAGPRAFDAASGGSCIMLLIFGVVITAVTAYLRK